MGHTYFNWINDKVVSFLIRTENIRVQFSEFLNYPYIKKHWIVVVYIFARRVNGALWKLRPLPYKNCITCIFITELEILIIELKRSIQLNLLGSILPNSFRARCIIRRTLQLNHDIHIKVFQATSISQV